jgi:hypothetical protein
VTLVEVSALRSDFLIEIEAIGGVNRCPRFACIRSRGWSANR